MLQPLLHFMASHEILRKKEFEDNVEQLLSVMELIRKVCQFAVFKSIATLQILLKLLLLLILGGLNCGFFIHIKP